MSESESRDRAIREVRGAILDTESFGAATMHAKSGLAPWQRVTLRPVVIQAQSKVQVSAWDGKQDRTMNYGASDLATALDALLAEDWQRIHVRTTKRDVHVRVTKKGKVLLTTAPPTGNSDTQPTHDHAKERLVDPTTGAKVLSAMGVANAKGKIRPSMRHKYRQIESFCQMVDRAVAGQFEEDEAISLMDCGCGSAYLTFAAYHVLAERRGRTVHVEGVDTNAGLMAKVRHQAADLGWEDMVFHVASIADVVPERIPDVVLSLHACDTATDEALARGVSWGSRLILSAPCCQHELHDQLHEPTFRPVLRHGILRERMADILTDSLRALALRIMGYRTTVSEFVDPAHTSRNIMIQAEKGLPVGDPQIVAEYKALTSYWDVEPIIARLLGAPFEEALGKSHKR